MRRHTKIWNFILRTYRTRIIDVNPYFTDNRVIFFYIILRLVKHNKELLQQNQELVEAISKLIKTVRKWTSENNKEC